MTFEGVTSEENTFIEQIKIGVELLINKTNFERIKTPERYSTLRSHHKKKSLTHTSLIHEIIKKSEQKENNLPFRPANMRLKLPGDLRNFQYSDLSDIFYSLNKSNLEIIHLHYLKSLGIQLKKQIKEMMIYQELRRTIHFLLISEKLQNY